MMMGGKCMPAGMQDDSKSEGSDPGEVLAQAQDCLKKISEMVGGSKDVPPDAQAALDQAMSSLNEFASIMGAPADEQPEEGPSVKGPVPMESAGKKGAMPVMG